MGVSVLPDYMCASRVDDGKLVNACENFRAEDREVFSLSPRDSIVRPHLTSLRMIIEEVLRPGDSRFALSA